MPTPVNTQIEAAFQANPPWDQTTAGNEEYEEYEEEWEEEGGWEYVSDHQGSGNSAHEPRIEPAVLYQPLGEATGGELAEHGQPEHGGSTHDVSGDGCGDGGYCGGHWVKRSEKGHRHGEPIGGSPWEPLDGFCISVGWTNPITGYACGAYGVARVTTQR
jgi:hypothetical protein